MIRRAGSRRGAITGAATLATALAASCSSGARVPAPSQVAAPLAPIEPAVIAVPITIAIGAIRTQLDASLPRTDSLDRVRCVTVGGVVCHQYVYRRDTLGISVTGDRVDVLARLHYRGRVALPIGTLGSCGYAPEAMRRAELRVSTTLYWRSDWRLASRDTRLGATLPDPCEVTLLRVDATPLMRRMVDAQLAGLAAQLDATLPTLADLRPAAESLWRVMQEPVAVDSLGTAWLVVAPDAVGVAPIVGRGGVVTTGVTIIAHPRVVTGARPAASRRPLPALTVADFTSGVRVPVEVRLPYADVARRAGDVLAAETAGQALRVTHVDVRGGAGDTTVVKLTMTGTMNGDLVLTGRPRYDAETRSLVIDDLDYAVASRDLLTRVKASLGALLVRRAIGEATSHGHLALGGQLDLLRMQLSQQMNRPLAPDVAIGGGIRDLRIVGLYTTSDAFVVRALLEGSAGMWAR